MRLAMKTRPSWPSSIRLIHLFCAPAVVPYVTSDERSRLGLIGWGSDVPQEALDAALGRQADAFLAAVEGAAAAAETPEPAAEPEPTPEPEPRKRARTRRGQFQADDQATADVNEAYEAV
jgi:hypothetical protein